MVVYIVMANTNYDGDYPDSVHLNESDAIAREHEIDNGALPNVDFATVVPMEVS